jgi:uncharacterized protein YbbC (DUF1343 family)
MLRGLNFLIEYLVSVIKVSVIVVIALLVPRLFLYSVHNQHKAATTSLYTLGVENLSEPLLRSFLVRATPCYTVALIIADLGKDGVGKRTVDMLVKKGIPIKAVFMSQYNQMSTACNVASNTVYVSDAHIPLVHWYDVRDQERKEQYLRTVDMVVFDVPGSGLQQQDAPLLLDVMKAARACGKKLVILDRPNGLGSFMEGPIHHETNNKRLVVPERHGMTTGELAHYLNKYVMTSPVAMRVVPMENYHRHAVIAQENESKSVPLHSEYSCSFVKLLSEVAPFDIGLGTDKAYQCILLPDSLGFSKEKWYRLREILVTHGIESKFCLLQSACTSDACSGLALFIRDITTFSSLSALLAVLSFFKHEGVELSFSSHFDAVVGSSKVREFFQGAIGRQVLEHEVNNELLSFFDRAKTACMYMPLPKLVRV